MAYEFPGSNFGYDEYAEAMAQVVKVLEKYDSLVSRLDQLETVTQAYPAQWGQAIANSESAMRLLISQSEVRLENKIMQAIIIANQYTNDQLSTYSNMINARMEKLELQVAALSDQYGKLARSFYDFVKQYDVDKVSMDNRITNLSNALSDFKNATEQDIFEIHEHFIEIEDDISDIKSKMLENVNTVVNPITGEEDTIQKVIDMTYNSLRTCTSLTARQIEGREITAGRVADVHLNGAELSGGGRKVLTGKKNNPVTGLQEYINGILSFIPNTEKEWTNESTKSTGAEYGMLKEKDLNYGQWRVTGSEFALDEWYLKASDGERCSVYTESLTDYAYGKQQIYSKYKPYMVIFETQNSAGNWTTLCVDWAYINSNIEFTMPVKNDRVKLKVTIYANITKDGD